MRQEERVLESASAAPAPQLFSLEGVSAGYEGTTVLRGATLAVPTGYIVALLGPNGAGKTTLLRVASKLLEVRTGSITLGGQDVTSWSPYQLAAAGVCHIPEGRGIFRGLSVQENVRLQAHGLREDEAISLATAAFPVLGARLGQIAGTLSGGEQQMLALARAYVQQPKFVLLDEVSMGLAPMIVDEIFDFLGRLAGQGAGLLVVEQYIARALELADFVFVLSKGEITFAGETGEVSGEAMMQEYVGTTGSASQN